MTTSPSAPPPSGLTRLNTAAPDEARAALHTVCTSRAWVDTVLAARPWPDGGALLAAADTALAELTADDLAEALAGHPPIGRPRADDPVSAREQSGTAGADATLRAELAALNEEYRTVFGQVFLICATGLTGAEMRDALRTRLGHPPERERETVRAELRAIHRIRLTRLIGPATAPAGAPEQQSTVTDTAPGGAPDRPVTASVSTHILDTSAGRPAPDVPVTLLARRGPGAPWREAGRSTTDRDGRCRDLPPLPPGTTHARLDFTTGDHLAGRTGAAPFFPEVSVAFAVAPGEHHHIPLLLSPFGYAVYRGS
ncbi:2-oxo-4-hydroxy-4-carboxy-5-ureidoimidazoline decarboxylase [Streptomyces sp. NPDC000594]|uniref:2-oxo-4-hydroxy-4-carboxy-5-ureidoimidazoline decarboxylase n=1 Tax=Streptomyces sp. NPDC000594 TaxID=3154261 RepID=UPI003316A27D